MGKTAQPYIYATYCLLQGGEPGQALVMLEHSKTRLLVEALALGDADLSILPASQQTQLLTARKAVQSLEAEMHLPVDTPARRDDRMLADLLRQARADLNSLIAEIRKDHPDFMPTGLDLPDILAIIPEDGALVAPLITPQGSAVFVIPHGAGDVTQEQIILLDGLREDDLDALLRGSEEKPGWLRAYLLRRSTLDFLNDLTCITGEVWNVLLGPIHERLQALKVNRVLLMPSGGLQLLPLHAAWREVDGERRAFLDDYEVVYTPSVYALDVAQRRAAHRNDTSALVAGVNDYADPGVTPLMNAVAEAEAVARLLSADPLLDRAATKGVIMTHAAGCATLHLSCHGYFSWADPMTSGLILYDDHLTLAEIIGHLNLDTTRLVTLSACETGITEVTQSPDEYVGLPAGFLQAGAPAVVSSLWTVDDRSTALLMERFYKNHKEGMPYPAALREAQLWLRDATKEEIGDYYKSFLSTRMSKPEAYAAWTDLDRQWKNHDDRPYSSPFYWAAFTFSGA